MTYRIGALRLLVTPGSPDTRLLSNGDRVVELTPKALRMLEVLASRPDAIVTRDELRSAVWPGEFVEDGNITRHVSLVRACLRQELGDGDHLLTLSKQGYRLNIPVAVEGRETEAGPAQSSFEAQPLPFQMEVASTALSVGSRSSKPYWIAGVGLCALVLAGAWGARQLHRPQAEQAKVPVASMELPEATPSNLTQSALHPAPNDRVRPSLAIVDLANNSRNKSWDWLGTAIREVIWMDFNSSEDIKIVNGQNTIDSEVDLDLPQKVYDSGLIRKIGKRMNADYVVVGSYRVNDKHIHVEMEMMQARDRMSLDSFSLEATEETLIPELAKAVNQFRTRLDLPVAATPAANVLPLAAGFTGLKPFAEGVRLQRLGFPAEAHPPLLRAAKLNPLSPMAHLELSRNSGKIGMPDLAASEAHFAIQVSGALPPETKLYVRARVHYYAAQYTECAEDYKRLIRLRPDDREYKMYLGECYFSGNQAEQELKMVTPLLGLHDPRFDRQAARDALRLHDWPKALEYADAQVRDASAIYATAIVANGMVTRARARVQLNDMTGAVSDFKEAITIAEHKQLLWELARAYELLGDAQRKNNNAAEVLLDYQHMLAIWRRLGEKRNVLESMEQVAFAQKAVHDYDGARRTLRDALEYADATENAKFAADGNLDLAEVSFEQKDMKAASGYAQIALQKAMSTGAANVAGAAQDDLGDIALAQGDVISARNCFQQGLELAKQAKDDALLARTLQRLATLESAAGNSDAAAKWQAQIAVKSQ